MRIEVEGADLRDPFLVLPEELEEVIREATAFLEREVKRRTPIGVTEAARGSIAGEVRRGAPLGRGERIPYGVVGSPLEHVAVLERGRRPGRRMPPPDALELWVRRRLGIRNVDEARAVAWVIARAIGRRGTKAVRMFERALEENRTTIERILARAGIRIAVRMTTPRGHA